MLVEKWLCDIFCDCVKIQRLLGKAWITRKTAPAEGRLTKSHHEKLNLETGSDWYKINELTTREIWLQDEIDIYYFNILHTNTQQKVLFQEM
jgi:hypothetical protein